MDTVSNAEMPSNSRYGGSLTFDKRQRRQPYLMPIYIHSTHNHEDVLLYYDVEMEASAFRWF